MKHILNSYAVLAVFLCSSSALAGNISESLEGSANVAIVSEYSFRGIAQSNEQPAVQGGFDLAHDTGVYAGIWGSNVDFNDNNEASSEFDLYAGYSGSYEGVSYDIGAIYYAYPGANSALNYDFWEASFALGYDFGHFATSATLNYSPDYFGASGHAEYYALAVDVPLPNEFVLNTHIGHQNIENNRAFGVKDYTDWSVGVGYNLYGFDLSLAYIDTDLDEPHECSDGCTERVIFSVSRNF